MGFMEKGPATVAGPALESRIGYWIRPVLFTP
jgi:hypothetical protein